MLAVTQIMTGMLRELYKRKKFIYQHRPSYPGYFHLTSFLSGHYLQPSYFQSCSQNRNTICVQLALFCSEVSTVLHGLHVRHSVAM